MSEEEANSSEKKQTAIPLSIEEEEEDYCFDEDCILDIHLLDYDIKNPPELNFQLDYVISTTMSMIQLKRGPKSRAALHLLETNSEFIHQLMPHLFWLVHQRKYHQNCKPKIEHLTNIIGKMWFHFCFPFETDTTLDSRVRDIFFNAIPYFCTQAIQHIYILITHGNPSTTSKAFRMSVCGIVVNIFTTITPLQSQIEKKLANAFKRPPPAELPDNPRKKNDDGQDVLLPVEDLTTLIEVEHRKRPIDSEWNLASISTLFQISTKRRTVPLEHDFKISIQYPQDDETDWTTALPPLLPQIKTRREKNLTFQTYNPMNDPRSLLHRSRRPDLSQQIGDMLDHFDKEAEDQQEKLKRVSAENNQLRKRLRSAKPEIKKKFLKDLRSLQLEKKRNETPEILDDKQASIGPTPINSTNNSPRLQVQPAMSIATMSASAYSMSDRVTFSQVF